MTVYLGGERLYDATEIRGTRVSKVAPQDEEVLKYSQPVDKYVPAAVEGTGMEVHGNEYHDPTFSEEGHDHLEVDITDLGDTVCLDAELGAHANDPDVHHSKEHGNEAHNPTMAVMTKGAQFPGAPSAGDMHFLTGAQRPYIYCE